MYSYNYNSADGLMGTAQPQIVGILTTKHTSTPSLPMALFPRENLPRVVMFYLNGVDSSVVDGNLNTVPVTKEGHWQVDMDSVDVDGSPAVSSLSAIIDTGTVLLVGDHDLVSQFYRNISDAQYVSSIVGDGFYAFPCNLSPLGVMTFRQDMGIVMLQSLQVIADSISGYGFDALYWGGLALDTTTDTTRIISHYREFSITEYAINNNLTLLVSRSLNSRMSLRFPQKLLC
jgi:hypothetical protein